VIEADDDNQFVEDAQSAFDELEVSHGRWVEDARVDGQTRLTTGSG
jgi:hypothetical protein